MKSSKLLLWFIGLTILTILVTKGAFYLQDQPGGITGAFEELGTFNVIVLFCLPLMAVVFSVYPPLMYPFVVVGYPFMWLWRKIRGVGQGEQK